MEILDPKIDKLLEKYNAELIEDPSLSPETESSISFGLESLDLEDLGQDSSSQNQRNDNPVNLLTKDIKTALKSNPATKINTRMKAAEFIKITTRDGKRNSY